MKILPVILIVLLASCNDEPSSTNEPGKDSGVEKVNNDEPYQPDSIVEDIEEPPQNFVIYKTDWLQTGKHGILYSKKVADLMEQKQKEFNTGIQPPDSPDLIDETELKKLTSKDVLFYCLGFPCDFQQNCVSTQLPDAGEMAIIPFLPASEHELSLLQRKEMELRRDSITALLILELKNAEIIPMDFLRVIDEMNYTELIPTLCNKADFDENTGCYTLLARFMGYSEYDPYTTSTLEGKLSAMHGSAGKVKVTKKEAEELKKFAMGFYKEKHSK